MTRTLKILFVEDNPDDEVLILREIVRGGYEVVHRRVETAQAMLQALRSEPWDIIISDFSLPSFNAPEAVRTLKETGLDIPILIVSGTVGEETAVASLKAGAHDFLSKNSLNRLLPAIERELREAHGRNARRIEQSRLRESEEALSAVFGASPLPIVTTDAAGVVIGWNLAAEKVFGWTTEEATGRHLSFTSTTAQEDWLDRVLNGGTISRCETGGAHKSGKEMNMLVFASPLHDDQHQASGAVCIFSDVTEQRALEEQLRQAQKMEAVGRLAGGVAHDFNNILTAIQGYATLLQDEVPVGSNARSDVDGILDAAARAAAFTRQLLAFSRKQVTQPEPLDANQLVSSMLSMLSRVIGTMYELQFTPGTNLRPTFADRGQIGQVILNLVVNARDAMPDGGKIILRTERVEQKPPNRIRADNTEMEGPYTVLRIRDSGSGIPDDTLARIFEPFFTTKDPQKGTGLGLSTVYGIVTQHGGFLGIETSPAGTEFSVYLPERETSGDAKTDSTIMAPQTTHAPTTILVEDDQGIRDLLIRALTRAGLRVLTAEDGETALDLLRVHPETRVLITDLMLPGMTGADLIAAVRRNYSDVRTVLMSGYSAQDLVLSSDVVFITKPFAPDELIAAVRKLFLSMSPTQ